MKLIHHFFSDWWWVQQLLCVLGNKPLSNKQQLKFNVHALRQPRLLKLVVRIVYLIIIKLENFQNILGTRQILAKCKQQFWIEISILNQVCAKTGLLRPNMIYIALWVLILLAWLDKMSWLKLDKRVAIFSGFTKKLPDHKWSISINSTY